MQETNELPKQKSKSNILVLIIVLILIGLGLYWYLNLPQTAAFVSPAVASFDATHNFDNTRENQIGTGSLVLAPHIKVDASNTYATLSVAVWSQDAAKVVMLTSLNIEGVSLPQPSNLLLSPTQVRPGTHLFYLEQTIAENIPMADLLAAAEKHSDKLVLTVQAQVIENIPQRVVKNETFKYTFDAKTRRILPWED